MEPKKEGKQIDRSLRKSRANVADVLVKTHKEFLKAIVSHQRSVICSHFIFVDILVIHSCSLDLYDCAGVPEQS